MRIEFVSTPSEIIPATERLFVLVAPTRRVELLSGIPQLRFNVAHLKWLMTERDANGRFIVAWRQLADQLNGFLAYDLTDAESDALYRFFAYAHFHSTVGIGFSAHAVGEFIGVFLSKLLEDHDLTGAIDRYVAHAFPAAYDEATDLARLIFLSKLLIPVIGQLMQLEREDETNMKDRDPASFNVVRSIVERCYPVAKDVVGDVVNQVVEEKPKRAAFARLAMRQFFGRQIACFRLESGATILQFAAHQLRESLAISYSNFRNEEARKRRNAILNHPSCILLERRGSGVSEFYVHCIGAEVAVKFTPTRTFTASDAAAYLGLIWDVTGIPPVEPADIRLPKLTPQCIRLYVADFGDRIETLCDIDVEFSKTRADSGTVTWTTRQDKYRTFANTNRAERINVATEWAAALLMAATPISDKDPTHWAGN